MLIDDLVQKTRTNMWAVESVYESGPVQTMLSPSEVKMLEWLARNHPLNDGSVIVDAGAFLGGSTTAFATGLRQNQSKSIIHSYDMFLVPNDAYSQKMIGKRRVGTSVLDIFRKNIKGFVDLVSIHAGDFATAMPPKSPIGILFLDLAKTWDLNQRAISAYFPLMVPGHTIVVQQDHNDQSCPWVNVTMEYFADYFEYLTDDGASRVYLYKKAIPAEMLSVPLKSLPIDERIDLAKQAAARSRDSVSAFLSYASVTWIIADRSYAEARAYLDNEMPPQPWESPLPYSEQIKKALDALEQRGYDHYAANYFRAKPAFRRWLHKATLIFKSP